MISNLNTNHIVSGSCWFHIFSQQSNSPDAYWANTYRQIANIIRNWVKNEVDDHSAVVGVSPVGIAPTISSFSTKHLASVNCVETTASRDEKHSYFRAWCDLYSISDGNFVLQIYIKNKSIHQTPFFIHMLQFSQHNSVFISRKNSKNFVSQYQRKKITNIRVVLVFLYLICSLRYQWITDVWLISKNNTIVR